MPNNNQFSFAISLSVLNHLGRNLYRSVATVLGEAISNSWDANAENVHIYIDKGRNSFCIKDDGDGMTADDFQSKFLKIGYSKRKEGNNSPDKNRPYIGRKGIGKLALLSCSEKITIVSRVKGAKNYIGGVIDNSGLDDAITEDLTPEEYPLGEWSLDTFGKYTNGHIKGTIIYFENFNDGIKNNLEFLRKTIALYFRFSLLDQNFNIYIDDEKISHDCLMDLVLKTEFLWEINDINDPFIQLLKEKDVLKENTQISIPKNMSILGFIASVEKPRNLSIIFTGERVSVDLFVNGRVREKDILNRIPTARLPENYIYGQIHFDDLEDVEKDRFTSGRENIVADDPKYKSLLDILRKEVINKVIEEWDEWRRKHREEGDSENPRIPKKERKAVELYNEVSKEYSLPEKSENKQKVDGWVNDLSADATLNFTSYADCFTSENLIREYIKEKNISLSDKVNESVQDCRKKERENMKKGNISIDIRRENNDLNYLDMNYLAKLVDPQCGLQSGLTNDAKQYKPIRDALMHSALLTEEAKMKLTTVFDNIKKRIKTLLSGE